ncbi:MAG TPA: CHAT domain-containing tetratricopeptide repeat protein [Pyrinomonadaceae bacterium]|nr:CHAT domain-containing tetratricopeptide repeat protein [Pyrinomonadaceae bacterium]
MSRKETARGRFTRGRSKVPGARLVRDLTVALLALTCCCHPVLKAQTPPPPPAPDPAKQVESVAASARKQTEAQPLEPGSSLEGELAGGQARRYLVKLEAEQFARFVVEQRGVDVVLRVFAADNTLLARANDVEVPAGSEQVAVLAEAAGVYQLEIQAVEEAEAGRYVVRLAEVRAPTSQDRANAAGERVLLDASRSLGERTAESRRLAIRKYEEAATHFSQAGERAREAAAIAQIGTVHVWMGNRQEAHAYFNRALKLQRENGNRSGEARVLSGLGLLYVWTGEWQSALDHHQQALALRRSAGDLPGMIVSLDHIGMVYAALGESRRALDYYKQAFAILSETSSPRMEAKLVGDIGEAYEALGEKQKALKHYERALSLRRKRNNHGGSALMLQRIGLLHASVGEFQSALAQFEEALRIQQTLGNIKAADTLTSIGEIYYRIGDGAKALDYLGRSSALRVATPEMPAEALTRYWVARVRRDQGDLTGALREIERAVRIVESLRSKIASHELRASYFATVGEYYDLYIDLLMGLHARNPSAGYEETALAASESARARSLLELLREARADVRRGVSASLLERERFLQRQLNAKAEEQSGIRANGRTGKQAAQLAGELETLTTELLELEAEIRRKSPRYAALTQPRPLGLKEIQQLLDPDTLLLEYKLGETRSYLWAVAPSSIKAFELPRRSEIETEARRLYELLTERNRQVNAETLAQRQARLKRAEQEFTTTSTRLRQMLLDPVASLLGHKRLVVIGDGALHYIPFAALPAPETPASASTMRKARGESNAAGESKMTRESGANGADAEAAAGMTDSVPADASAAKLLIVDHEIINLPSASVLAALRRDMTGRKSAPRSVAVLADPVFDERDARVRAGVKANANRGSSVAARQPLAARQSIAARQPHAARQSLAAQQPVAAPEAIAAQQADAFPPAYTSVEQSGLDTNLTWSGNTIPRLSFSRREAAAILASAPAGQSKAALDFGASRATVTGGELSRYRYIHFATHGLLNSRHPELSGIVLSLVDEQGRPQNGFLRLHEIYNLELPADLIVLSACQTGLGKEIKGEGLVGLTRGFMYAGAARVAASLWKVDDAATAELMRRFYFEMLKNGLSPTAAMRRAQIEMAGQKRWRSPYYWAAFTVQGDWR